MSEKITFTIGREIHRGKTKVGSIDYHALKDGPRWKVKLHSTSGRPGIVGDYLLLGNSRRAHCKIRGGCMP